MDIGDTKKMLIPGIAYMPDQWSGFLSAEVGASAALTGLLFVAVSINLTRILAFPHLIPRVARDLAMLAGILVAASIGLVPGQSKDWMGAEFIVIGGVVWITVTLKQLAYSRGNPYSSRPQRIFYGALCQLSTAPIILCGISLLYAAGGGFYWLVLAVVASLVAVLLDTWVLLIEIHR